MIKFKTIKNNETAEIEEKRSRFIASIYYVETVEEAEEAIKQTKKKYYDAKHNCFAYIIQEKENTKREITYLCFELKTTTYDITISICSDSHYYWRTPGRYRARCYGRRRIGDTHVRFWFTAYRPSYRRHVDDCRRYLGSFLYASRRRTGLYGETGRTFAP